MNTYLRITLDLLLQNVFPSGAPAMPAATRAVLLRAPAQQIANGILLEQAKDYRVIAQELLIDYLLSDAANSSTEPAAGSVRDSLENLRLLLISLGDDFDKIDLQHKRSIAGSQSKLIGLATKLPDHEKIKHDTKAFVIAAQEMHGESKITVEKFYDALIQVKSTLALAPEYRPAPSSLGPTGP